MYNVGQGSSLLTAGQPFEYEHVYNRESDFPCGAESDSSVDMDRLLVEDIAVKENFRYPGTDLGRSRLEYDCNDLGCGIRIRDNDRLDEIAIQTKEGNKIITKVYEAFGLPHLSKDITIYILVGIIVLLVLYIAMSKKK